MWLLFFIVFLGLGVVGFCARAIAKPSRDKSNLADSFEIIEVN